MELLRGLDRRWRSFRHGQAADVAFITAEQLAQQSTQQQSLPPSPTAAAVAATLEMHSHDLHGSSYDQGSSSSSRASSPTEGYRAPPRAYIHAMAGYDVCDSAGSSDISRITPLRIQGIDEIEIDFEKRPPQLTKSRFTTTPLPKPGGSTADGDATGAAPISRRSLAARCAAAASAAAGAAVRSTRYKVSGLLKKVPSGHLPTAEAPKVAPSPEAGTKAGLRQRLRGKWQKHPVIAACCLVAFLGLMAIVLGVAIGVSAQTKGRFPWWAKGGGDDMWIPTGDSQLDSLLRLKAAVDQNNLLTGWTTANGRNGGYCSWDFVTCDAAGTTVEAVNLTTTTYTYVFQGHLPSGEVLSGLTGLKVLDIREHHISGPLPEDWYQLPLEEIRLDQNVIEGELPAAWFGEGPLSGSLRVLTLWDNKLTGTLPGTQGGMQKLQQLDLSFNSLEGSLPSSWSSMVSLQQLWANTNKLSGPLPASWSAMTSLQKLVLSENSLSGALPPSWSGMAGLAELWLEFNNLSGQLPDSYSSLSNLRTLVLNNNSLSLSVPPSWGQLGKLSAAYLYNNGELQGCLPFEWKARFASDFDVAYYLLEGTGLTGFCGTTSPAAAELPPSQPAPTVPEADAVPKPEPSALPAIQAPDAPGSTTAAEPSLTPALPEEPRQPPQPQPQPQPTVPPQTTAEEPTPPTPQEPAPPAPAEPQAPISEPAAAEPKPPETRPPPPKPSKGDRPSVPVRPKPAPAPEVPPTPAAESLPTVPAAAPEPTSEGQLAALLALKSSLDTKSVLNGLWTSSNPDFCSWPLVECDDAGIVRTLNLTTNEYESTLSGRLPSGAQVFSGLSGLRQFDARMHNIGGSLPADWGPATMPNIEVIKLDQNKLTGWLPSGWSGLSKLKEVTLSNNRLAGPLPASWGSLTDMQHLDLSFNSIGGSLPHSWGAWAHVQSIHLEANKLMGPLPASWGAMGSLETLVLSENGLKGQLPASWADMRSLQELWLEFNQLSGPLPSSWSALGGTLQKLALNNNDFSGSVPRSWVRFREVAGPMYLYLFDNPELTGCLPFGLKQQLQYDIDMYVHHGTGIRGYCPS